MGKKGCPGSRRLDALNLEFPDMTTLFKDNRLWAPTTTSNDVATTHTTAPTGSTRTPAAPPSEAQLRALQMRGPISISTRPSSEPEVAAPP